jgi:hypothetical protein
MNANVTNKTAKGIFNVIDPGGGLSNTMNYISGGKLFKKKGGDSIVIPNYYLDPYYDTVQSELYNAGSGMVSGNIDDYYKAIGMTNSQEFQDMLALGVRDIQKAGNESLARTGVRGARGASGIASAVADYETQNRYADYARSLQGKEFLLGTGLNTLQSVRSGALTQSELMNNYNFNVLNAKMGLQTMANSAASAQGNAQGSGISSIANLAGMFGNSGSSSGGSSGSLSGVSTELGNYSANNYSGIGNNSSFNISDYYNLGSASGSGTGLASMASKAI